jgi:acyl dehydratase
MSCISASPPSMDDLLHFEDFAAGQEIALGPYRVTRDEIVAFASEFDPQPFHVDEEAARASVLGGLAASGWHSCAMLMRMMADAYVSRTAGLGSPGMAEVKWLKPVLAGETLTGKTTVLACRRSATRPELGIVECRWELFNDRGEKKVEQTGTAFVRVRTRC